MNSRSSLLPFDGFFPSSVPLSMSSTILSLLFTIPVSVSLICHQCTGWTGSYSRAATEINTCDSYNNQCQTEFFCVRIEDPIIEKAGYKTYKADCWMQTQLQATPTQSIPITTGVCYNVTDSSVPPKQWRYCFCSNGAYCNSSRTGTTFLVFLSVLIVLFSY